MNLYEYLQVETPSELVNEGGASGHMSQIIDYSDLSLQDLKDIVYSLFSGKIKATEKLDGLNIQASMSGSGEVIFARNKGDMNKRALGGMTLEELSLKYEGRGLVKDTFDSGAQVIEKVFTQIGPQFFNPTSQTRLWLNCECIHAGVTNIMLYASSRVYFHDIWTYTQDPVSHEWTKQGTDRRGLEKIKNVLDKLDTGASLTPEVLIDQTEEGHQARDRFIKELNELWKKSGLGPKDTIDTYKRLRFEKWLGDHSSWALKDKDGTSALFERLINNNITIPLTKLKKLYPENQTQLNWLLDKKNTRACYEYTIEDLDSLFLELTNSLLGLVRGIVNSGLESKAVSILQKDLEDTLKSLQDSDQADSEYAKTTLVRQLARLQKAGPINPLEGIVFSWKGKTMKCTGSFGPLNQILGNLKYK